MTPDLQQEFQVLSAKADQQLRAVPAFRRYRHLFSIWTLPSFSPSSRWTIYAPLPSSKGKSPFASYTVWRSDLDLEKFSSPVVRLSHPKDLAPTIQGEEVILTADIIEGFEQSIRGIAIPFFPGGPPPVGCDGTGFEFHYGGLSCGGSLRWGEDRPQEWRPLTGAVRKIAADLAARREKIPSSC